MGEEVRLERGTEVSIDEPVVEGILAVRASLPVYPVKLLETGQVVLAACLSDPDAPRVELVYPTG